MDQCEDADEEVPLLQEQRRRSKSKSAELKCTQPSCGPEDSRVSSSPVSACPSWCCSFCCMERPDSPEPESIPGAVPEHEPEPGLQPGQELEPESKAPPFLLPQAEPGLQSEPVSGPELEPAHECDLESEADLEPEQGLENECEPGPQLRPQPKSEPRPEPVSAYVLTCGPVSDLKPEPEPGLESDLAAEPEPGPDPKPEAVPEPDPDSEADQQHDSVMSKDQDESWENIWLNPNYTEVKLQLKGFLEDLDSLELKHFHWYLQNADQSKDGFKAIKKCRLEHADRLDTVDLMVQMYTSQSGVVAEKILEKMKSSKAEKTLTEVVFWEASAVPAAAEEKDLARMMSDFVKKVSKENLVELMEALVDDKVLNDLEKKSVLEGNHTKVNKASGFVEIVTEKGDEACKKMMDHLQSIDSTFSSELGLSAAPPTKAELRLVLLGGGGAGKSAAGNTILGKKLFHSVLSASSCTLSSHKVVADVLARRVSVVDTPGLFNHQLSPDQLRAELLKAVQLSSPGPHVFLFTLSVGRVTKEEEEAIQMLQEMLSPDVSKHIMLLFTHGDLLEEDGLVMEEMIRESSSLQKLLEDCSGQYQLFNNRKMEDRKQVQELLDKIDSISEGGRCFYERRSQSALEDEQTAEAIIVKLLQEVGNDLDQHLASQSFFSSVRGLSSPPSAKTELRLVLLGGGGAGKSAAGNTILGKKLFHSVLSASSCTLSSHKVVADVLARRVSVVDTPGLFNHQLSPDQLRAELLKAVQLSSPGPHVFLFTLSVGRVTKEEEEAIQMLQEMLSPDVSKHIMLLFTHGDLLEEDGLVMEEMIRESSSLQKLLEDCSGQYQLFNNRKMEDRKQVQELLDKIDSISEGGRCFYERRPQSGLLGWGVVRKLFAGRSQIP